VMKMKKNKRKIKWGNVWKLALWGLCLIAISLLVTVGSLYLASEQHHRLLNSYDCEVMPY
jgi:hypothetical protein